MTRSLEPIWHLYRLSKLELADRLAGESIRQFPEWSAAYLLRSLIRAKADRIDEAIADAEQGLSLQPDDDWSHYVMAYVMLCQNDCSRAKYHLLIAIGLEPESAEYFRLLAHVFIQTWELDSAYRAALQSLILDPEYVPALREYGLLKYHHNRNNDSAAVFQYVLSIDPEDDYCHRLLGWISLDRDNPEKAVTHFAESLRLDPLSSDAQSGLEYAKNRGNILHQKLSEWINGRDGCNEPDVESTVQNMIFHDLERYLHPREFSQFEAGSTIVLEIHSVPMSGSLAPKLNATSETASPGSDLILEHCLIPSGNIISTSSNEILSSRPVSNSQFPGLNLNQDTQQTVPDSLILSPRSIKWILMTMALLLLIAILRAIFLSI